MYRRVTIVASLTVIMVMAMAGTAGAHTLTKERAKNASVRGAEKHCDNDPYCDTSSAGNCRRPPASGHRRRHKVQCDVVLAGTDSEGEWQCTWVDQWSIANASNRLRWSQAVYDDTVDCHHLTS